MARLNVSAKADYALRAVLELAPSQEGFNSGIIATRQGIPGPFLKRIRRELVGAGLVVSRRGFRGGYWLARPPAEITVADVLRAVEPPAEPHPGDSALDGLWAALRSNIDTMLEHVTLADLL
jgi:Rrf2 family protein